MSSHKKTEHSGFNLHKEGQAPVRAIVLHVDYKHTKSSINRNAQAKLAEAVGLACAIDLCIEAQLIIVLARPKSATLLGTGKVKELALLVQQTEAELVIVNAPLSPIQQRNLEKQWATKVLDRTGLILEIFGRRATTNEGRLQVELAHLHYQKSRLVRSWTHLERQRGGFGFLGGPGESQLEADRRLIEERIRKIEKQLEQVSKTRALHRTARARVPYPILALVGYTNSGKSTLFNRLTSANVLAKDLLFATLDPTMRLMTLPKGRKVILSDTVGFISDLPTGLIAAFRATLEEVLAADIILHVRDVSHEETEAQSRDVIKVLEELGVSVDNKQNLIEVWNKADQLEVLDLEMKTMQAQRRNDCVLISALTGSGIDALAQLIEDRLGQAASVFEIFIENSDGKSRAWLYDIGEILQIDALTPTRTRILVRIDKDKAAQAFAKFGKSIRLEA